MHDLLPHDSDLERSIIGACMLQPEAEEAILARVDVDDFFMDSEKQVCIALKHLSSQGSPTVTDAVVQRLRDTDKLQRVGGMEYLVEVLGATPAIAPSRMGDFVKRLHELSKRRKAIQEARTLAAEISAAGADAKVDDIVAGAQGRLQGIVDDREANTRCTLKDAAKGFWKGLQAEAEARRENRTTKPSSGLSRLDRILGGGIPMSKLIILAGRSSMGKTAFALGLADAVAGTRADPPFGCHIITSETDRERIAARIISSESRIDMNSILTGVLDKEGWSRVTAATKAATERRITVDDIENPTLEQLRASIRWATMSHLSSGGRLGCVIFDYLQLARVANTKISREQEITQIANGLMYMAHHFKVPIVALSQLNRGVENRQNKRPILADLRESGGIEQAAHAVLGLYRDEYYNRGSKDAGITEIHILKNKDGPTGMVKASFVKEWMRFSDLEDREQP